MGAKDKDVTLPNGQKGRTSGGPGPIASVVKVEHGDGSGYHLEWYTNDKLKFDK